MKRLGLLTSVLAAAAMLLAAAFAGAVGDVRVLSTGIGKDERTPRPEYSLLVICSERKGALIAGVLLKILKSDGTTVAELKSEGPWLFASLPAGEYRVEGKRSNGVVRMATVSVPESGQAVLYLSW
jgi:hypothetical protein